MSICVNLWSIKTISGLTFLSTDYHRLSQIFLISKDIVIITDFYFGHGWTRLFQRHGWLRIDIIHGTSWLRLALQVRGFLFHWVFLSTDYHRLTQIFLISKDIVIITDFLGTEIHCFFKDTAWLRIDIIHGTSWLRLALQVRGLVCSAVTSRVYTCIALRLIKPFPSRSPAVSFI